MKKYWVGLLAIVMGLFISSCKNAGGSSDKDEDDEDKKETVDFKEQFQDLKSKLKNVETADELIDVLRDFYNAGIEYFESDPSSEEFEEMSKEIDNCFNHFSVAFQALDKDEQNKLTENSVVEEEMAKLADRFSSAMNKCQMKMDSEKENDTYNDIEEEPLDSMAVYDDYLYEEMDSVY